MNPTINQPFMKYENNVIYLSAGSEWVPISNIIKRLDDLESRFNDLIERMKDEKR